MLRIYYQLVSSIMVGLILIKFFIQILSIISLVGNEKINLQKEEIIH